MGQKLHLGALSALSLLEAGRAASTLKVHMVAISLHHAPIDRRQVGVHHWVVQFLRSVRRIRPNREKHEPAWHLSSLCQVGLLEIFQSRQLSSFAVKTAKHVGELHALSISPTCLR